MSKVSSELPRSAFARKLAADPELAARCEEVANAVREAARPDIEAVIRSQQIGPDDLRIYINTRSDSMLQD